MPIAQGYIHIKQAKGQQMYTTHPCSHTRNPLALRHMALSMLGKDDNTSLVTGMGLLITEFRTTPGRPLSCNADSCDGSWKIKAVVTSVAEANK